MSARRLLPAVCTAAALLFGGVAPLPAFAAPEQAATQAPGFYRWALGGFEITALYDGYVDIHMKLLHGMPQKKMQELVARMFLDHSQGVQTAVNAYLVHTGDRLVLVDAGAAACFGPTLGNIVGNIRAAGYKPEDVDTVLLTHMHPDHLCGLAGVEGQAAFPNAQVWASQKDADFWLSDKIMNAAPQGNQPFFKMAMNAVAPYQAAGNFKTFQDGDVIVPGAITVPTNGHTPGHTSYLFESKGRKLLIWGDVIHNHAVQFMHPEVSLEFDVDQKQAIIARKKVMADAAKNAWAVAGAHLPFPGLGHIRKEKAGYAWVPVEYGPIRKDR